MIKYVIGIVCVLILVYVLSVFRRGKLNFWYYITGSIGVFLLMMFFLKPYLTFHLQDRLRHYPVLSVTLQVFFLHILNMVLYLLSRNLAL